MIQLDSPETGVSPTVLEPAFANRKEALSAAVAIIALTGMVGMGETYIAPRPAVYIAGGIAGLAALAGRHFNHSGSA